MGVLTMPLFDHDASGLKKGWYNLPIDDILQVTLQVTLIFDMYSIIFLKLIFKRM
jgi:hypothetical protein